MAGGDKVPRKGGPGITQSDVLVINKSVLPTCRYMSPLPPTRPHRLTLLDWPAALRRPSAHTHMRAHAQDASCAPRVPQDLADAVGADLGVMEVDAARMRGEGPTVLAAVKQGRGVPEIEEHLLAAWRAATGNAKI